VHLGQALSGRKRPPGPGRCLQVHFKGQRSNPELRAKETSALSPPAPGKINPPMGWTHFHSKTNLEQSLGGCQQPAGTRWSLQVPLKGNGSNSQPRANESSTLRQAPRTRQMIKSPMGWTHDHSKVHLGQALSRGKRPPGPGWSLQVHFKGQRSNSRLRANKTSALSPPAPGKRSNQQWDGPTSTPKQIWNNP
jgi:hypothetical protein